MTLPRNAMLLRAFFGEDDKFKGRPRYEAIVMEAREAQTPSRRCGQIRARPSAISAPASPDGANSDRAKKDAA